MRFRELTLIALMLFGSLFLLVFAKSGYDVQTDLFSKDEYPDDLDTLEEFIQSYYLLLDSDTYLKDYSYVNPELNALQNDQESLNTFYMKLLQLRNGIRDQVIIYQIGDSHIQSGYFSGTARSALQKYFGNAGRGLIFPYRLAKTNQPDDYQITSPSRLKRKDKPCSLSGYTLSVDSEAELKIKTNAFFKIDCTFDQALLYANNEANLILEEQDGASELTRKELEDYSIHHIRYQSAINTANIKLPSTLDELYGISIERSEAGLLYHSMGVNGAGFYTLAKQDMLFEQISLLNPDLIVVSLGTNDAQGKYRRSAVEKNIEDFMRRLENSNQNTPILFTLAPDSRKNGKINADISNVNKLIQEYAKDNNHAVWNLFEIMGGAGSITNWRNNAMAAKDLLHFTPKGYMLQGHLFYQAIIKGYKEFSEKRDK